MISNTNNIHKTAKFSPNIIIGKYNKIGENVIIETVNNSNSKIIIGDNNIINKDTRIIIDGDMNVGDWNVFHNNMLIMSGNNLKIGHNCWFGQNTILDGTGGLLIGNGVRVGMYSQIWTHVASGERIEGCTLYDKRKTIIEDDVWLVGSCIVGSGIKLAKRSIFLINSLVAKDSLPNKTYAGSPAVIKEGLNFYKEITIKEKNEMLIKWLVKFSNSNNYELIKNEEYIIIKDLKYKQQVVFAKKDIDCFSKQDSVFYLHNKTFNKTNIALERKIYKYLYTSKARFIPQ